MSDYFKTTAQKAAEGKKRGRDDSKDDPETQYKIKARSRVPLADAGTLHTGVVKGRASKRALVRDLERQGFDVVKVESKKPGGWFWW